MDTENEADKEAKKYIDKEMPKIEREEYLDNMTKSSKRERTIKDEKKDAPVKNSPKQNKERTDYIDKKSTNIDGLKANKKDEEYRPKGNKKEEKDYEKIADLFYPTMKGKDKKEETSKIEKNNEEKEITKLEKNSQKPKKKEKDYEAIANVLYPTMSDKKQGQLTGGAAKVEGNKESKGEIKYGVPYNSLTNAYSDQNSLEKVLNDKNTLYKNELNDNRKDWERDDDFVRGLKFVYLLEGGYSNRKEDLGGETNLGITQDTYNYYNKKHNLPLKSVKNITEDETSKIYYDEYWKASGASKIKDKAMAMAYFDTAVNHGAGNAKKIYNRSGDDVNKFLEERKKFYDEILKNKPKQIANYNGWMNRVKNLRKYLEENNY